MTEQPALPRHQRIDANAQQGSARLTVTFADGTDVDQATLDVQRRLAAIGRLLPVDATQPSVQKADPAAIPVLYIVLSGKLPPDNGCTSSVSPATDRAATAMRFWVRVPVLSTHSTVVWPRVSMALRRRVSTWWVARRCNAGACSATIRRISSNRSCKISL